MKKIKYFKLLSFSMAAFFFVSCAGPQTPADRIAKRPDDFAQLSKEHQELVQKGQISKGMTTTAVALSWGSPSGRVTGEQDGRRFERWTYNRYRSRVVNRLGAGWGGPWGGPWRGGFGPWRRGWGGACGGACGGPWGGGWIAPQTSVVWVPERAAIVRFRNNRVFAWEANQ